MTNEEFSNEFDTLVNSNSTFSSTLTPLEFDEYEKSVFLTKAQESVVISLYKGTLTGDSFEKTEEMRRYLGNLIITYDTDTKEEDIDGIDNSSVFFKLPTDLWFITYESATISSDTDKCINKLVVPVIPVR